MSLSTRITPILGWNSWNCYGLSITQEHIYQQARALVDLGLAEIGYEYVIIDDGWQGDRGGNWGAIQGNQKFSQLPELIADIHQFDLKVGIYSTPWERSYGGYPGSGGHLAADLQQWQAWGVDFVKYDWDMSRDRETNRRYIHEISEGVQKLARPMILSLANTAPVVDGEFYACHANMWRTTGDIVDSWESVYGIGLYQSEWRRFCGPGRWNDADMLVLGQVGWGEQQHPTRLNRDEQALHAGLWHFLAAPLILGCDLTRLDKFTLNLLTRPALQAIHQDPTVRGSELVYSDSHFDLLLRPLQNARGLAIINKSNAPQHIRLNSAELLNLAPTLQQVGPIHVIHDVWTGQVIEHHADELLIPAHGLGLFMILPA